MITGDTIGVEKERHREFAGARTPPARTGFLYFLLELELDLLSDLHRGGEDFILVRTDMPELLHDLPTSHSPRPARPGSRAPIAL